MPKPMYEYEASPIPADFCLGLSWLNDEGKRFETYPTMLNGKRVVELSESTYVGSCALGAMHYYARFIVRTGVEDKKGSSFGGYLGKATPKEYNSRLTFDAVRRLTKVEKDMDGDVLGRVGDCTSRFNTPKEAREAAIAGFLKCFGPGWILRGEDENGNYEVLAET